MILYKFCFKQKIDLLAIFSRKTARSSFVVRTIAKWGGRGIEFSSFTAKEIYLICYLDETQKLSNLYLDKFFMNYLYLEPGAKHC